MYLISIYNIFLKEKINKDLEGHGSLKTILVVPSLRTTVAWGEKEKPL